MAAPLSASATTKDVQSLQDFFVGSKNYVSVHALDGGYLTLPASQFIEPCSPNLRLTVPSLSFLIQHQDNNGKTTRIVFDLGLRRELTKYPQELQGHLESRQPLRTDPDVKKSLEKGRLTTDDIDMVIYSHVHWDHVGTPGDFQRSHFVVGEGTLKLLASGATAGSAKGSHSHFEPDLLPPDRTVELLNQGSANAAQNHADSMAALPEAICNASTSWKRLLQFPAALDVFGDQSMFIVQAPGHLEGHTNLLCRIDKDRWIYLAGDACHDRRLLTGEKNIAEWQDVHGATCCIHANKAKAIETLEYIREFDAQFGAEVEIILAHDSSWAARNEAKFWPGKL